MIRAALASGWRGAVLMLRRDPAAMAHFDVSVEGFWRSFAAPLLVTPVNLVAVLPVALALERDATQMAVVRILTDLSAIVAFPLLMVPVARLLGLGGTYVPFIVANNFASLPIAVVYMMLTAVVAFAGAVGGLSGVATVQFWIGLPLLALVLGYIWQVARIALQAPAGTAAAITAIQYLLALVLEQLFERLLV